jgi:hypothetical protein
MGTPRAARGRGGAALRTHLELAVGRRRRTVVGLDRRAFAQVELQPPAVVGGARAAPDFERADLGELADHVHRQGAGGELLAEAQHRADGRQLVQRVARRAHHRAGAVAEPRARGEQREAHRLVGEDAELRRRDLDLGALVHAALHQAEGIDHVARRARGRRQTDEIGPRAAAADAHAEPAPHQAVVRGAARTARSRLAVSRTSGICPLRQLASSALSRSRISGGVSAPPLKRHASGPS